MAFLRDLLHLAYTAHPFILLAAWGYLALHLASWMGWGLIAWLALTFAGCPVYIFAVTRPAAQRLFRRIDAAFGESL